MSQEDHFPSRGTSKLPSGSAFPSTPSRSTARSVRLQRSVTDGTVTPSASGDRERTSLPVNPIKSSYFDTYQPYKLNPALTPSVKASRSKSEKNLRQARDRTAVHAARVPDAECKPTLDTPSISTPTQSKAHHQHHAVSEAAIVEEHRRRLTSDRCAERRSSQSRNAPTAEIFAGTAHSTNGTNSSRPKDCTNTCADLTDKSCNGAASIEAWRKVAREAATRSPGGYASIIPAGVTRRKSQQNLKAFSKDGASTRPVCLPEENQPSSAVQNVRRKQPRSTHEMMSEHAKVTSVSVDSYRRLVADAQQTPASRSFPHRGEDRGSFRTASNATPKPEWFRAKSGLDSAFQAPVYSVSVQDRTRASTTVTPVPRSISDIIMEYTSTQKKTNMRGTVQASADDYDSDDSLDSITKEVQETLLLSTSPLSQSQRTRRNSMLNASEALDVRADLIGQNRLYHSSSFHSMPSVGRSGPIGSLPLQSPISVDKLRTAKGLHHSSNTRTGGRKLHTTLDTLELRHRTDSSASSFSVTTSLSDQVRSGEMIDRSARSARLNRLVKLTRQPNCGLKVSFADVGDHDGHPVIVYLGLGAVRYLVGLYDELASALHLRLICIDRWGIGKTDDVPNERRGLLEWVSVVEDVAQILDIFEFSVLAHSAGAPYAMAMALLNSHRITGPVHLLAPWVSPEVETSYRWLKYVPEPILRTAQAAEWRMTGWRLGKSSEAEDSSDMPVSGMDGPRRKSSSPSHSSQGPTPSATSAVSQSSVTGGSVNKQAAGGKSKSSLLGSLFGGAIKQSGASSDAAESSATLLQASEHWQDRPLSPTARQDEDGHVVSRAGLAAEDLRVEQCPSPAPSFLTSFLSQGFPDTDSSADGWNMSVAGGIAPSRRSKSLRNVQQHIASASGPLSSSLQPRPALSGPTSVRQPSDNGYQSGDPRKVSGSASLQSSHAHSPDLIHDGDDLRSIPPGDILPISQVSTSMIPGSGGSTSTSIVEAANSLLRASYSESLRTGGLGSTSDLMTILGGRSAKPWGFTFKDVRHPAKVWHGEKDERIGLGSAMWMERECPNVSVRIVKGANHGLMTNTAVVVEALESIASSCRR